VVLRTWMMLGASFNAMENIIATVAYKSKNTLADEELGTIANWYLKGEWGERLYPAGAEESFIRDATIVRNWNRFVYRRYADARKAMESIVPRSYLSNRRVLGNQNDDSI